MYFLQVAGPDSIETIRSLARNTWTVSYRSMISAEQIEYMLEMMYSPSSLLHQMNTGHQFLLLRDNEIPCGFAALSPAGTQTGAYRLHKLYVLPEYQGKGLGKLLLDGVIARAKEAGGEMLELNVNRSNPSTGFYKHEGFEIRESVDLEIGGGYFMNDYIMEKKI